MNKFISLIIILLSLSLVSSAIVSAESINIMLMGPADNSALNSYEIDFLFGFDQEPDTIDNCSVFVDGKAMGFRNTLEQGNHEWYIICYDFDFNKIESEQRSFVLNKGDRVVDGYDIFYNSNGLKTYIFTVAPGQPQTELPPMKAGEDIELKIGKDAFNIDILKISSSDGVPFVEFMNRATYERVQVSKSKSARFDVNKDDIDEVELFLSDIERGVNAYIVVIPYPEESQIPISEEENKETVEESVEEGEEEKENEEVIIEDETNPKEEFIEKDEEKKKEEKESFLNTKYFIIAGLIIILIIIIILSYVLGKEKVSEIKEENEDINKNRYCIWNTGICTNILCRDCKCVNRINHRICC